MAASILGITTLTFGVPTITGLIVNSSSFSETVNVAEVIGEDGDYLAAALHGRRTSASVSGTANGGTFSTGATLTLAGAPSGTYYITEITQDRTADGFQQFSISAQAWAGMA
jgi:hypothetical protein